MTGRADKVDPSDLRDLLDECAISYPPLSLSRFIPCDDLDRIVTPERIKAELDKEASVPVDEKITCADNTYTKARKVFALLSFVHQTRWLYLLYKEGLIDDHLPLLPEENYMISKATAYEGNSFKAFQHWQNYDRHQFNRLQWLFLAPIFKNLGEHKELYNNCVLPFIYQDIKVIRSGQSSIYKVKAHPAHFPFYKTDGVCSLLSSNRLVKLKSIGEISDVSRENALFINRRDV
jgi:hypothetical protein